MTQTMQVKPKYVPEGYVFPQNFPTQLFKEGSDYPQWEADAQQWVWMIGPNGEPTYYNAKLQYWITFGHYYEVKPDGSVVEYRIPLQHQRGGGGATILPFQLVQNEMGVVTDIRIAFWAKARRNIVSDSGFIDFEAMGGFRDKGETPAQTAVREHSEESGGMQAGEEFEASLRRGCIDRAVVYLAHEKEGVSTFAYLASDEQMTEFERTGDHPVMSWMEAVMSRCEITKASVLDLIAWVKRNYETAL
jgi:hypothetical protein